MTKKTLRTFFKLELNLPPSVNIKTIMKSFGAESQEECYILMHECYEQIKITTQHLQKFVEQVNKERVFDFSKVINRFDDLPFELKSIVTSYLPKHIITEYFEPINKAYNKYVDTLKDDSYYYKTHYTSNDHKVEMERRRLEDKIKQQYCIDDNVISLVKIWKLDFYKYSRNPRFKHRGYTHDIEYYKKYNGSNMTNEHMIKELRKLKIKFVNSIEYERKKRFSRELGQAWEDCIKYSSPQKIVKSLSDIGKERLFAQLL